MYIIRMTQKYQQTKYPSIYKSSHCGRNSAILYPIIIEKRNSFLRQNNLSTYRRNSKIPNKKLEDIYMMLDEKNNRLPHTEKMLQGFMRYESIDHSDRDHTEYYNIKGSNSKEILLVFSMYLRNGEDPHFANKKKAIWEHGYCEVPPIYALHQKTFVKMV